MRTLTTRQRNGRVNAFGNKIILTTGDSIGTTTVTIAVVTGCCNGQGMVPPGVVNHQRGTVLQRWTR